MTAFRHFCILFLANALVVAVTLGEDCSVAGKIEHLQKNRIDTATVQNAMEHFFDSVSEAASIPQGAMGFNHLMIGRGSKLPGPKLRDRWESLLTRNTPGSQAAALGEMEGWVVKNYPHWSNQKISRELLFVRSELTDAAPNKERRLAIPDITPQKYAAKKAQMLELARQVLQVRKSAPEFDPKYPMTPENIVENLWGGVYDFDEDNVHHPTMNISRAKQYEWWLCHSTTAAQNDKLIPLIDAFEEHIGGTW